MKERVRQLDLIRVICTFGIFYYHFFVTRIDSLVTIGKYNSSIGGICVAVFFLVSGFSLRINNETITPKYYFNRVLTIYPAFWIAYFYFYTRAVFRTGRLFPWDGTSKWSIIQSILGIDGLLAIHGFRNCYQIGEWFLGCLIIFYLIYPIILFLVKKSACLVFIIISVIFGIELVIYHQNIPMFLVIPELNILTQLFNFGIGVIFGSIHRKKTIPNALCIAGGALMLVGGYFIPHSTLANCSIGIGSFLLLFRISEPFLKNDHIYKPIIFLSSISYSFYLIHHGVILDAGYVTENNILKSFVFSFFVTIFFGSILHFFSKNIISAIKKHPALHK